MFIVVSNTRVFVFKDEVSAVKYCSFLRSLGLPSALYMQMDPNGMDTFKYPNSRLIDLMGK